MLSTSTYQAVICSPSLIVVDGSSLVARTHWARPPVPFLLTIKPDEREFVQHWLDLGVYDVILNPLQPRQAIESVQQALVLSSRARDDCKERKDLGQSSRATRTVSERRSEHSARPPNG
jgi:DNA-binding NtrC family response regulator